MVQQKGVLQLPSYPIMPSLLYLLLYSKGALPVILRNTSRNAFTHQGFVPEFECYEACAPAWTQYIQERLTYALAKKEQVEAK